jgi:LPS-assembly protein
MLIPVYLFITIMGFAVRHPQLIAQEVPNQAPAPAGLPDGPSADQVSSSVLLYPVAKVLPGPDDTMPVTIESSGPQSMEGNKYILDGDVVVTYGDRKIAADHIEYDKVTSEVTATGHVKITGGPNNEIITATHGTLNTKTQAGWFYDVSGSVGLKQSANKLVYANSNPFLFTGKVVVKTGPQGYEVYNGTVTSCQLPHPDWQLFSNKFTVDEEKARATNSVFHLMSLPVFYMPYVTHPVDASDRQSGILLPVIGESSTKGLVLGEQIYWAINRSTDITVGVQYFSRRGWETAATIRYKGQGNDFLTSHYSGLQDRGYVTGGQYVNQGGQDVVLSARKDFSPVDGVAKTRVATDLEYLSSYPYREAFTENFNQAVSTDILSIAYGVHESDGYAAGVRFDRYQGLKLVPTATLPGEEVKIWHVPSLDFDMTEHEMGNTGLYWNLESTAAGLKRSEPGFTTSGIVERFDFHPFLSYPLSADGWNFRPTVGVRETFYSRSRVTPYPPGPPVENTGSLNRSDFEASMDIRPPVIERTFTSGWVRNLLRHDFKHTVEPEITYRYVAGIDNFLNILRFDDVDVASDTNELEYGVTQRLFIKPRPGTEEEKPCKPLSSAEVGALGERVKDDGDIPSTTKCKGRQWISWELRQKHFFDQTFGGAVIDGRRNVLETTLNFSGIAFLTEPRAISPLVSRLRVRASENVDVEWDWDYDTGAKKFTSNNVLVDVRADRWFTGLSYARLNAPGRSYSEGVTSSTSDFNQMRLLAGWGSPSKRGLGVAANAGLDLRLGTIQYAAVQTSYNWDCCGLNFEYRKYELGSVRNENAYRFNFTLVNIGTAGNLRRAERLF